MKKLLVLGMVVALCAAVLVGCSNGNSTIEGDDTSSPNSQESNGSSNDANVEKTSFYYGKIKNIVGNEIELDLADMGLGEQGEEDEEGTGDMIGGTIITIPAVPSIKVEEGESFDTSKDFGGLELDYTGETKSFILPAGAKINKFGTEQTLSDLKAGSVVFITATEGERPIVTTVDIYE